MIITFERTGGFSGMVVASTFDLNTLPEEDAALLKGLVLNSDFFNITEVNSSKRMPDGFQYTITIKTGLKQRTLHLSDHLIPEMVRPLLTELSSQALSRRRPE